MGKVLIGKDVALNKPLISTSSSNDNVINSLISRIDTLENNILSTQETDSAPGPIVGVDELNDIKQNVENIDKKIKTIENLIKQLKQSDLSTQGVGVMFSNLEKNIADKNNKAQDEILDNIKENTSSIEKIESITTSSRETLGFLSKTISGDMKDLIALVKSIDNSEIEARLLNKINDLEQATSLEIKQIEKTQKCIISELMSFYDRQHYLLNKHNSYQKKLAIGIGVSVFLSIVSVIINMI
jgi:hypothetical protein